MNNRWRASGLVFCGLFLILAANSTFSRAGDAALPSLSTVLNPDGYVTLQPESQGSFDPSGYRMVLDEKNQPRFVPESPEGLDFRTLARMQRDRATAKPPTRNAPIIFPGDDNWSTQYAFKGCDYGVFAVAAGSGGTLYIGGAFSYVNGILVNGVAQWNGTTWSALGGGVSLSGGRYGMINSISVNGSDVYVAGQFDHAGTVAANNVAKWNGTSWSALGTGTDDYCNAVLATGTNVYVGGFFQNAGGVAAPYAARWNGTAWSALGALDDEVMAFATNVMGTIYVGGWFTASGSTTLNYIAQWSTAAGDWAGLVDGAKTGMNNAVYTLACDASGNLYAGGNFTNAGADNSATRIAMWNGATWSHFGTGAAAGVWGITFVGTDLYICGSFTTAGGTAVNYSAKWNGTAWSALGGMLSTTYGAATDGTNVYMGGNFLQAGGVNCNRIGKYSPTPGTWSSMETTFGGRGCNGSIYCVTLDGSNIYVGGFFTMIGDVNALCIAKWNGTAWSALGAGVNSSVWAILVDGTNVYATGAFTAAGGAAANRIARWDGTNWNTLGTGLSNNTGYCLAKYGSNIWVGGTFTTPNRIAQWDGSTWSTTPFGTGPNSGGVYALAVSGTTAYVGGSFTTFNGVAGTSYITRYNGSTWSALGTSVNNQVRAIYLDGSDVIAGGYFTTAGGTACGYIAKWNGTAWSTYGAGFTSANGYVMAITKYNGEIYVGGQFTESTYFYHYYAAKWNGSAWLPLGSGVEYWIYTVAALPDGVLFGGAFVKAGVTPSARLAKWVDVRPPVDMNGDCSTDLVMRNTTDGSLTVWYMTEDGYGGSGYLGGPVNVKDAMNVHLAPFDWMVKGIGDFNGDGFNDLLWQRGSTGDVIFWLTAVDGHSSDIYVGTVTAAGWKIVGVGDCNGDRRSDILWIDNTTGLMSVWYCDAAGRTGIGYLGGNTDMTYKYMGTGDLNGDGFADNVMRNSVTGDVYVQYNNASGPSGSLSLGNKPTTCTMLGIADCDWDRRADILFRDTGTGMIDVWYVDETGVKGTASFGPCAPATWTCVGVGDFAGNGNAGILWRNPTSGDMSLWLVDGTGFVKDVYMGNAATAWSVLNPVNFPGGVY